MKKDLYVSHGNITHIVDTPCTDCKKVEDEYQQAFKSGEIDQIIRIEPYRVQRKLTKGWRMPPNTKYVGRPTKWGNKFKVGNTYSWFGAQHIVSNTEEACKMFEQYLLANGKNHEAREQLKGSNLACWCALDQPCHADILLQIANS